MRDGFRLPDGKSEIFGTATSASVVFYAEILPCGIFSFGCVDLLKISEARRAGLFYDAGVIGRIPCGLAPESALDRSIRWSRG
jgi:hypothetical protein